MIVPERRAMGNRKSLFLSSKYPIVKDFMVSVPFGGSDLLVPSMLTMV